MAGARMFFSDYGRFEYAPFSEWLERRGTPPADIDRIMVDVMVIEEERQAVADIARKKTEAQRKVAAAHAKR